jgi:hypothetical protein
VVPGSSSEWIVEGVPFLTVLEKLAMAVCCSEGQVQGMSLSGA